MREEISVDHDFHGQQLIHGIVKLGEMLSDIVAFRHFMLRQPLE